MSDETTQDQPVATGGRYSVADDGRIFWQENATNPLPGEPVGAIAKGTALLAPKADVPGRADAQDWLDIHIRTVLEPLFKLLQTEGEGALTGAAAEIGKRLYDHLGVMRRSDLDDVIPGLDPDLRRALRAKGVRMGPVLVFLPALVKPAAIRLRALLWALWNDQALPATRPADGRVSEVVDPAAIDRDYYRMIGYPVFGPRCIRIDMLDRVVTDVYDSARDGVFEAVHKYAEWFGCNLDDLHAILESMGHRRLKDDDKPAEPAAETEIAEAPEAPVTDVPAVAADAAAVVEAVPPKAPVALVKFMLKRGRMAERGRGPRRPDDKREEKREDRQKEDRKKKVEPKRAYDPNKPDTKREDRRPRKDKDRKGGRDRDDREGKVYSFTGKKSGDDDDSNPFAILKNLKK